jgi:uncharacterized RDD family membrane protein YckC
MPESKARAAADSGVRSQGARAAPPASLPRRLAALLYDSLLLGAVLFCATFIVVILRGGHAVAPETWWFDLYLAGLAYLFYGWFWTHGGQTLGMRAWRIRVERLDGRPLRWRDALFRGLAAIVAFVPLGISYWAGAFDAERRCWHDRWSRTRMIRI